jgi:hypothetical protein
MRKTIDLYIYNERLFSVFIMIDKSSACVQLCI